MYEVNPVYWNLRDIRHWGFQRGVLFRINQPIFRVKTKSILRTLGSRSESKVHYLCEMDFESSSNTLRYDEQFREFLKEGRRIRITHESYIQSIWEPRESYVVSSALVSEAEFLMQIPQWYWPRLEAATNYANKMTAQGMDDKDLTY